MFRKRLTWFWILLSLVSAVIAARLVQIQVVQAGEYQALAQRILTRPVRYVPAPRGSVFDQRGQLLLADEPTFSVCVHYGVLAGRDDYLLSVARALRERGDFPQSQTVREISDELRVRVGRMWDRLVDLTGEPMDSIHQRATEARQRVDRVRDHIRALSPNIQRIAEEDQWLPVLENVDNAAALKIRLELESLPWLRVLPGSRRVARNADAVAHLLGRLGAASAEAIAADPLRADELRRLRPGDRCGVSGIEQVGEASLRGQVGRVVEDISRGVLERRDPVPGHDVHLTIDLELQQFVLEALEKAVSKSAAPSGAAVVVIDVHTREVLALVSYPTYHYDRFSEDYEALRQDTRDVPLLFRAVQAQYPPGSICKAISLVGALTDGVVTPETSFNCTGFLLPDHPDRFRCWIYNEYKLAHGPQDAEIAVRNSCNIYFFNLGQRLGPQRLCEWFSRFGLGRTQGTDLIEESPGIVPTEAWLRASRGRGYRPADAWNFAIGQGEVTTTPLQAANVAATIASGYWAPVRLAYDSTGHALGAEPAPPQTYEERHLRVLRRGMWRVVNDPHGTARDAKLELPGYELCGKTGSAQTVPRVLSTRYTLEWPDGRREEVVATSEQDALSQFDDPKPTVAGYRAYERYPALEEGEKLPSHAWFIGYTEPTSTSRGASPADAAYAISVVIEFGGSGGRVAGPVAREIAEYLLRQDRE